ncbi:MAG: COG1361 S-layer family protein [Halanaeroarchaeum sp.]
MTRFALVVVGVLFVSTVAGVGVVAATEDPRFEVYTPQETVAPGRTTDLAVTIVNDAEDPDDRVDPARAVEATMRPGDTPFEVTTGTQLLGAIRDGRPTVAHFGIDVPRTVESGTYRLPIDLTYEYDGDERETTTVYATVRVADRAVFTVVETTDTARVGAQGVVNVTVRNVGTAPASDATVELASKSPHLAFGGTSATNRAAGDWAPGETKTLTYEVSAKPTAEARPYSLTATVAYDDEDGNRRRSAPLTASVTPEPEHRFAVATAEGTSLSVGDDGTLALHVTNEGRRAIEDATVTLVSDAMGLHPDRRQFGLGTVRAGETVTATFPFEVGEEAAAGPRRFAVRVAYDQPDGDRITSTPYGTQVTVGPRADRFDLRVVNASVPAGASGSVTLAVTNAGDEPLAAVDAKAFTNAPFTVTDDAAFVGEMAPGETTTVSFGVSVPGDALTKRYPLSVDFQYDTPDGDTELSDTYDVPVRVTAAAGLPTRLLLAAGVAGVLVVGGLGYWYVRD